jgi:two-component system sensor histidine kinase UhpB
MPLRFRLIAAVAAALLASVALGGAAMLLNASREVRAEMRAALLVGHQTVVAVVRDLPSSGDPRRDLDDLIASFKGARHLQVWIGAAPLAGASEPLHESPPAAKVPVWFAGLIGVVPEMAQVPVAIAGRPFGTIVIETDPRNEIGEVWHELKAAFVVLALFCGQLIPLIYLFIGGALRPLGRLTAAMEQVGRGDYAVVRVGTRLAPELARLRDSFNRMAARLAAADADNRRLNQHLLTLQDEERSEIAHDLHDEVGPLLFAINVDIANASRLLKQGRIAEVPGQLQSIGDGVQHLQRQVRGMLGRLRPIGLAEFGLAEALCGLVEFWRRRHPEIDYRVGISPRGASLGKFADAMVYRIVQECLSNAVRHGEPRLIAISVDRAGRRDGDVDDVTVEVADDGKGMQGVPRMGYGLIGMEERVRATGGRLTFSNRPAGGFAVSAAFPCAEPDQPPAPPPSEAR